MHWAWNSIQCEMLQQQKRQDCLFCGAFQFVDCSHLAPCLQPENFHECVKMLFMFEVLLQIHVATVSGLCTHSQISCSLNIKHSTDIFCYRHTLEVCSGVHVISIVF